ncbi:hypothetical protein U9M48_009499 [Paspalum notatum var. saurae]|uniref:Uncharacterized protein n=1 Tax=Paspalum notatum var. saurae TaxID=547442 RepID=A0AAQ3SRR3_PASNO
MGVKQVPVPWCAVESRSSEVGRIRFRRPNLWALHAARGAYAAGAGWRRRGAELTAPVSPIRFQSNRSTPPCRRRRLLQKASVQFNRGHDTR